MFISIGSVIIDDIVLPGGTTHMGCLGGGSVHAVMGMRVWSEQVGVVGNIGNDFPPELMEKVSRTFDVRGLTKQDKKTSRAWQIFEADGKRTEIFRTDLEEFLSMEPDIHSFPDVFESVEGVHLLSPLKSTLEWIEFLRQRYDPFILWEPWNMECDPSNVGEFLKIFPLVDCVSPNLQEARNILGSDDLDILLDKFLANGTKMAAIRMGANGSVCIDSEGHCFQVPAVEVEKIIDQTGAGNAYCGGLVVGMVQSKNLKEALCKAAVSASFPLEQFGALFPVENIQEKTAQRFQHCMQRMA